MTGRNSDLDAMQGGLARFFRAVVAGRWIIVAAYALLLPPCVHFALKVDQDNSIDRLIVESDPDHIATRAFEKMFGSGEYALLMLEADDPLAPAVIERLDRLERAVQQVPRVSVNSILSIYRRAKAGFTPTPEQSEDFRRFATGTGLFRRQGLIGEHYIALALLLDVHGTEDRRNLLAAIDAAVQPLEADLGPLQGIHRLGQPYVNVYLDQTQRSIHRYFVVFMVFVIVLNLSLYRSWRALLAFLITLGVSLAVSMAYIGASGGMLTIVSPMVPMTVLVTVTATLVYIHSRFVDHPPRISLAEHQIFALTNKFVACTASMFASAVGFAALLVSDIRPIREMGLWVAVGLIFSWAIVFTLFPALQRILHTPTQQERQAAAPWFKTFARWLPTFTFRWRWPLVASALILSAGGAVALFGFPGIVPSVPLLTDPVEYMNHSTPLYKDIKRLGRMIPGLSMTHAWLRGGVGTFSEPDVLDGLHAYQQALEADPEVGTVVGPTTILRIVRYIGGQGDGWPSAPEEIEQLAIDLEGVVPREPMLQRFVQQHGLGQAQLTVVSRAVEHESFARIDATIRRTWAETVKAHPALKDIALQIVGLAPLNAKMAGNLVPTLTESFVLTVIVIFAAFLIVFRSGTARLMALIPSIFAILVMFAVMRLSGMMLNVATILIASTVLGTSENDQIHFFYHYLEGRRTGTVEQALRHTLLVSGRAIFFATVINAGGFLAFVFGELPPMRQFSVLAASAFVLSMIADFTALPAALWILSRARPDEET